MVISDSMVEGVDFVVCPICGYPTKLLSTKHYLPKHGLTKEEFFIKFPGYKVCCDKRRQEISQHSKESWENPDSRDTRRKAIKIALNREEVKERISKNSKEMWNRDGFRAVNSEKIREGILSSDFPSKQSDRMKSFWSSEENKVLRSSEIREGIKSSDVFHESISKRMKETWEDDYSRKRLSEHIRKSLSNPEEVRRRSEKSKNYWSKESSRLKQSKASKSNWKNPEYVERVTKGYNMFHYTTKSGDTIYLRSSYEWKVCKYLEDSDIRFKYQMSGYKYIFEGVEHTYWPDFFLIDLGLILEVKPESFVDNPLVQEKYNAVKECGDNIIFVSEKDLDSIESFLHLIRTSTTIRKQDSIVK